jgi:hypothetical protein
MNQCRSNPKKMIACFLFSTIVFSMSCNKENAENPCPTLARKYKSVKEALQGADKIKLEKFVTNLKDKHSARAIASGGITAVPGEPVLETEAAEILKPMNDATLVYLAQTYPHLGPTGMIDCNDPDFIYFAQVYSIAEQGNLITPSGAKEPKKIPKWLHCTIDITMGYFDIRGIISGLGSFEFGTVWKVVKTVIKKYVGWIAAAILIYEIATECF